MIEDGIDPTVFTFTGEQPLLFDLAAGGEEKQIYKMLPLRAVCV